jgi:putative flippase GtrA
VLAQTLRRRFGQWGRPVPDGGAAYRDARQRQRLFPGPGSAWLAQVAKYSVVGVGNTALDAVLYLLLTRWLGLGGVKVLAKGLSYAVGTLNSFHWNRSWTFRSRVSAAATFLPFVLVSLTALALNALVMYLALALLGQQELLALALATGVTLLWNFAAGKFLVFRR